jgi:hypothetical protein
MQPQTSTYQASCTASSSHSRSTTTNASPSPEPRPDPKSPDHPRSLTPPSPPPSPAHHWEGTAVTQLGGSLRLIPGTQSCSTPSATSKVEAVPQPPPDPAPSTTAHPHRLHPRQVCMSTPPAMRRRAPPASRRHAICAA